VTGQYDAVAISEASDDAAVAKLALGNASMGFVRTETLRVFTEDEYRKIVESLCHERRHRARRFGRSKFRRRQPGDPRLRRSPSESAGSSGEPGAKSSAASSA